jgi:hypothetical protein
MNIREKLNRHDITHRRQFAEYATEHSASDWHQEHLARLYAFWDAANRDYFEGACVRPHILLAEPKTPSRLGDHAHVSGWGSRNQIRIRPSLIRGTHKLLKEGDEYAEGRMRYVEDVLLHESVHQYADEVLHTPEASYKGHGPVFAGECNRISERLGLGPVRPAKARGPLKDRPSCAQWPHNVRPTSYYLGALADPQPVSDNSDEADRPLLTFPCPLDPLAAIPVIAAHFEEMGLAVVLVGLILWRFGKEPTGKEWRTYALPTVERFQSGELSLPAPEPATLGNPF